jgi:hypothetical protein
LSGPLAAGRRVRSTKARPARRSRTEPPARRGGAVAAKRAWAWLAVASRAAASSARGQPGGSAPAGEAAAGRAARGPPPARRAQVSSSYSATRVVGCQRPWVVCGRSGRMRKGRTTTYSGEGRGRGAPDPAAAPTASPQRPPVTQRPRPAVAVKRGRLSALGDAIERVPGRLDAPVPELGVRSGSSLGGDRGKPSVQKRPRKPKGRPTWPWPATGTARRWAALRRRICVSGRGSQAR